MIKEEEVFRIGRLGKPHGVKGEVTMHLDDDLFDSVEPDYVILRVDGLLVPFYIEESRPRTTTTALVKFDDVDTVEQARQLTNSDVYLLRSMAVSTFNVQRSTFNVLRGYDIIDATTAQRLGTIADVNDTTANILFELQDGRLIPAAEEFITNVDHQQRQIEMQLPEGILSL